MPISTVDKGKQIKTYAYRNPAASASFNRFFSDLMPTGIYAGGMLTRYGDTTVSLGRLTVLIRSNEREADAITLRIETTVDQDISLAVSLGGSTCDPERCYIVARFGWEDVESDYMDFAVVKYSNDPGEYRPDYILPKDIVIGKVLFIQRDGDWIIRPNNCFDYTRRSRAFIPDENALYGMFRVLTCETDGSKVHVTGGSLSTSKGFKKVVGGDFPVNGLAPTGDYGRNDLVWVDSDGQIKILYGVSSASPVSPLYGGRRVLAEIRRGPNRSDIISDDVVQVNPLGQSGTVEIGDLSLADADGYFSVKNVEAALKQTWEKAEELEELLAALAKYSKDTRTDLEEHVADVVDDGIIHGIQICGEIPLD